MSEGVLNCCNLNLRTALLIYLCEARGLFWTLEQPSTSLAYRHPRFQAMLKKISRVFKVKFWLSKYGARSPKRLWVWGNSKAVRRFARSALTPNERKRLPERLARSSVNKHGRKTFTGDKKKLKESQPGT